MLLPRIEFGQQNIEDALCRHRSKQGAERAKLILAEKRPFKKGFSNGYQFFDSSYYGRNECIGRATARKLAKLGIHVLVVGRNPKRGHETLAEILAAGGKADFISSDFRNASSAREVAKRALELGDGHVDILIEQCRDLPVRPHRQNHGRRV
jgi:hypothetical protein